MISLVFSLLFAVILLLLAVPVVFLAAEVAAALLPVAAKEETATKGARPTAAILIPAHNEEQGISATLVSIKEQMSDRDRLVVVADNCSDQTAAVARAAGAEVLERQDVECRGKGFALDFGLRSLAENPPEVVVICDADVIIGPCALARLVGNAQRLQRPVQAKYIFEPPDAAEASIRVSAFALLFKNLVRPLGLARLGGGCLLTGTGMAFPWDLIKDAPLASGNIVEDMQLGIDLALVGKVTDFCPEAVVSSAMAPDTASAREQRTRWEHGHLLTIRQQVGRVLWQAIKQRRLDLFLLGLELGVPPLASLVLLWLGLSGMATLLVLAGFLPAALAAGFCILGLLLAVAVLSAWCRFGRELLPLRHLLSIPLYVLGKIPIYIGFLLKPQKEWVRTAREDEARRREDIDKGRRRG